MKEMSSGLTAASRQLQIADLQSDGSRGLHKSIDFYPTYSRGHLHPESEAVLRAIEASTAKPLTLKSPQEARISFLERSWLGEAAGSVHIDTRNIPGNNGTVPIRIYSPEGDAPRPILVFFHGGGFVLGTLDEFDPFCTFLSEGAACTVVSVGYRLAPEHRYPAAVEDAAAALRWVASHAAEMGGDPSRLAVAGDSAGANLAAVVCQMGQDAQIPQISLQVLICPWVDLTNASEAAESFNHFGQGLWLSRASIRWYRDHYLGMGQEMAEHPLASPLRAERLHGAPPALIISAEFDVLADQGRAYALRLKEEGVPVSFQEYPGMLHDFAILPGMFADARVAIRQITDALRAIFRIGGIPSA